MRASLSLPAVIMSWMLPFAAAASGVPATNVHPVTAPSAGPMDLLAEGDRLAAGADGKIDVGAAIAAYEAAIAKGSTIAFLRLGDLYRRGEIVRADPEKAFSLYKRAADAGNAAGKLRVAEMTARGQGTAQDADGGRAMARALADTGEPSAVYALGDMYSQGDAGPIDGPAAIAAYREAADKGSVKALVGLGAIYRDGALVSKDRALALDYFVKAADAGSKAARFAIAKGNALGQFGDASSPADGIRTLQELNEFGNKDAALVLSDSYFAGTGVRRDPKAAISVLDDAMERGNVAAARRLIAIYRDGRWPIVLRDLTRAHSYLAKVRGQLDQKTLAVEQLLLGAAAATSAGGYESVRAELAEVDTRSRPDVVRKLRGTNAHVYVYLVQSHLKQLGAYTGAANGRLNNGTIRAINKYCATVRTRAACIRGPLSKEVVEVFQPLL